MNFKKSQLLAEFFLSNLNNLIPLPPLKVTCFSVIILSSSPLVSAVWGGRTTRPTASYAYDRITWNES
jgi:hypothetical protein